MAGLGFRVRGREVGCNEARSSGHFESIEDNIYAF